MTETYPRHTPLRRRQHAIHLFVRHLLHEDIHEALSTVNPQRRREYNWQAVAEVALVQLIEPQLDNNLITVAEADLLELREDGLCLPCRST